MSRDPRRQFHARDHAFSEWVLDRRQCILLVDGERGFVSVGKGILQEFHNISFGLDGIEPLLAARVHRRLLSQNGRPDYVIHRCHVLHLLRERSHSLELAVGGSEGIFILRQRFRSRNELALHIA